MDVPLLFISVKHNVDPHFCTCTCMYIIFLGSISFGFEVETGTAWNGPPLLLFSFSSIHLDGSPLHFLIAKRNVTPIKFRYHFVIKIVRDQFVKNNPSKLRAHLELS